jgi:hypothetical protein
MADGGGEGQEGAQWALRFISGKYQGGEFPLRPNREIIIGRSSDLDMVLVEDMVSRKYAKTTTDANGTIQTRSTNGTFVNGEKVRADLGFGDRILIGTSIIDRFVDGDNTSHLTRRRRARRWRSCANKRSASSPKSMRAASRRFRCPTFPLLSTSKKSGVLVVHLTGTWARRLPQGADLLREHRTSSTSARARRCPDAGLTHGSRARAPDESAVLEEMDE